MKKIVKIVLTGGPCGGKTTILKILRERFAGKLLVVPEAATMLLANGFPVGGRDVKRSAMWKVFFQGAVVGVITNMEAAYELKAREDGVGLLVCDRGLLDGAAYVLGGKDFFYKYYGVNYEQAMKRYCGIIHLESLSVTDPALFEEEKHNNPIRYEGSLQESQEVDYGLREVWQEHPGWVLVNHQLLEHRIEAVVWMINNVLEGRDFDGPGN